jgi:hypothetical protein
MVPPQAEAPILKSATLKKEVAEVMHRTNAVEVRESERHEVLRASANLAGWNLGVIARNEGERLCWDLARDVKGVNDQIHNGVLVSALTTKVQPPKRWHEARGKAPNRGISCALERTNHK